MSRLRHWPNGLGCDLGRTEVMLQLVDGGRLVVSHDVDGCRIRYAHFYEHTITARTRISDIPASDLRRMIDHTRKHGRIVEV